MIGFASILKGRFEMGLRLLKLSGPIPFLSGWVSLCVLNERGTIPEMRDKLMIWMICGVSEGRLD